MTRNESVNHAWNYGRSLAAALSLLLMTPLRADNQAPPLLPVPDPAPAAATATPVEFKPGSSAPVPDFPPSNLGPMQAAPAPTAPAGQVISFPVLHRKGWNEPQGTIESASMLVPSQLPEKGFLSILVDNPSNLSLYSFNRSDFPPSLHFLFRGAEQLFLAPRQLGNHFSSNNPNVILSLGYDKNSTEPLTREVRIMDAAGRPLTDLEASTSFINIASGLAVPLSISADGNTTLPVITPAVIGTGNIDSGMPINHFGGYAIKFHDRTTSQSYSVDLYSTGKTSQTVVMLPMLREGDTSAPAGVTKYEAQITPPPGGSLRGVSVTINAPSPMRYGSEIINNRSFPKFDDEATVTVRAVGIAPGGHVQLAVPDSLNAYKDSGGRLSIAINDTSKDGFFTAIAGSLASNAANEIALPARLTLTAQLLDEEGNPFPIVNKTNNPSELFKIKWFDASGKDIQTANGFIDLKSTTGSLFTLKDLPVPGRYFLTAMERDFGPVDIGETSPTAPIAFKATRQDGQWTGRVLDSEGNPLAGALVAVRDSSTDWDNYFHALPLLPGLQSLDHAAALVRLNEACSGNADFSITTGTGEFLISRKALAGKSSPYLVALAPDRFLAFSYQGSQDNQKPLHENVEVSDVRLPEVTTATGVVSAPPMIPDEDHPGALKPLPAGAECGIFQWNTRAWFHDGNNQAPISSWQYDSPGTTAVFGKPFDVAVPVGTSYTVGARPRDIKLSLQLWKQPPASQGEQVQLTSETLRALQPFTLQVFYPNGQPAEGLDVSSIYDNSRSSRNGVLITRLTDSEGKFSMYGDEGLAPDMSISRMTSPRQAMERFRIQKLDMATSVPLLKVTLNPKIWGQDGEGIVR